MTRDTEISPEINNLPKQLIIEALKGRPGNQH